MGKKGSWINKVKKVLTIDSKDTKEKKSNDSKEKETVETSTSVSLPTSPDVSVKSENEHYSVAISTPEAVEVSRLAAQESQRLKEENAALKIQTTLRACFGKKELKTLKGLMRLKTLIQGQSVQQKSMIALQCMQTLSRVQSQIQSRTVRINRENLALLQQQLQRKGQKELDKSRASTAGSVGGDWNASVATKEQIETKLQNKEEAAKKRERALTYANSHRIGKHNLKSGNATATEQTDPFWGWSWLERWRETRPWEGRYVHTDYENASQKSRPTRISTLKPKPAISTPSAKTRITRPKSRPISPRGSKMAEPKSQRRHTIGGSSVRDDDNKTNSRKISSSQGPTNGVVNKAKPKVVTHRLVNGKSDSGSFGLAKKQLSYSLAPGERRHSGPPKVDTTTRRIDTRTL